ncbi:relaxase/mobilization nuclease domain-containing protein [Pedobacter hartonius]|uniref:Relaxase/Mobilisation nuclease domain-containing protein n=1 Tax=Pedobacter hartonius TaxID=425514 RepID=A0A1H4HKZ7_9SPHI|nr:relaxase/mobilization nuclease domain-containing protein [Pedobacter hartonius]SEB22351.1 Relaxase/Mobilisation nuclease domain-containing protein [Pedobacter hartonius]
MIGKVVIGKSFGGCVRYVVQKQDAQVLYGEGLRIENTDTMTHDLNMQRKINPALGNAVGHISLNWSAKDKDKLTPEIMLATAQEYLAKMKIRDTQVLIVQHKDRNHPHLHIIYNRVNNEGKTVSDQYQYKRNLQVCKELTVSQGFHLATGKAQVNREQLKGADKTKYQLYDMISKAIPMAKNWEQFEKILAKDNVSIQFKYKCTTDQVQGVSFGLNKQTFKGSEIDRSFSFGKLDARLNLGQQINKEVSRGKHYEKGEKNRAVYTPDHEGNQTPVVVSILKELLSPVYSAPDYGAPIPRKKKKKKKGRYPEVVISR